MNDNDKKALIAKMTDNLPVLRKALCLTQEQLANHIGVSRYTLISIEKKRRSMSWNTFLSLLLVFIKNEETDKLLSYYEIYTDEINDFLKLRGLDSSNNKKI